MSESLKPIGYWSRDQDKAEGLPWPSELVDDTWDVAERERVIAYLERGTIHESWRGWSTCRLCGRPNGSRDHTDDVYVWPEGYVHYVRDHAVRPPADFIAHALERYP